MGKTFEKRNMKRGSQEEPQSHEEEKNSSLPNSLVMRIMQQPDAEEEADRLSEGVTSTSPAALKREMGERLGADFSQVHFHSDANSVQRSQAMGAQAYTQGRDVYFGKKGFTPSLAAHELVHTVQQGAVSGNTTQSAPLGSVQMKPDKDSKFKAKRGSFDHNEEDKLEGDSSTLSQVEAQAMQTFNTSRGIEVYNSIMPDLKELVKKAGKNRDKKTEIKFRPKPAVSFMVRAAYQDYALRDILIELVNKPIGVFKAGTRIRQYKSLIKSIGDRLGEYQAEELALQTGMIDGAPKYKHNGKLRKTKSRAYQLSPEDENVDTFNPGNIPELKKIQDEIDAAETLDDAYATFAKFTGNRNGKVKKTEKAEQDPVQYQVNLDLTKKKLKHMTRQVWDYPELRNKIGDMILWDTSEKAKMAVQPTYGGYDNTVIKYNAYYDRLGEQGEKEREADQRNKRENQLINGDLDHAGNHELGHVLGFTMVSPGASRADAEKENRVHKTENDILKEVMLKQNILSPQQKRGVNIYSRNGVNHMDDKGLVIPPNKVAELYRKHQQDIDAGKKKKGDKVDGIYNKRNYYKGQLNTSNSPTLEDRNLTSGYGASAAHEMFAETFGDVYTHGKQAKKFSIATVKEYEKRQKELQRMKYNYNQSNWFMKLFRKKII